MADEGVPVDPPADRPADPSSGAEPAVLAGPEPTVPTVQGEAEPEVSPEPETAASAEPAQPLTRSDQALRRYRADMRRRRTVYYAVIAVLVVALATWVGVAWSRGEISHASLHTFGAPPPSLALSAPTQAQQQAWRTSDRVALGAPQYGGTVVTYSAHTVGGRDARTGARTWSYTRTDRFVCTAAQLSGTTIAVYSNKGNCDEVAAFYSDTGKRRWTRTLDMDAMPLNGQPSYQVTPSTVLLASSSVIYAIDPVTGYNRWTYSRYGCAIQHVVLGGAGALISQNCSDKLECKNLKFCARGQQLTLRNGSDGRDDDKPNADQIIWNQVGDDDVPVAADEQLVAAVTRDGGALHVFDPSKGDTTASIPLTPATSALGPVTAVATDGGEIVWVGGQTYAIAGGADKPLWRTDSTAPPTVVSTTGDELPQLATARITVPTNDGIAIVDGNDGQPIQSFTLPAPQPDSLVYPLGTGFLVAEPTDTVAYR